MAKLFVSSVSYHIYSCENNQFIVKVAYCKLVWSHIIENILPVFEPRCEKTGLRGFPTKSDTNRVVQPQKMAKGLTF